MKLIDEAVLDRFRGPGRCEACGKACHRDAHHIYSKGSGRVDLAINTVGLCRFCHTHHHAGARPTKQDLLTIAALREGVISEDIEAEVYRIRRLTKEGKEPR